MGDCPDITEIGRAGAQKKKGQTWGEGLARDWREGGGAQSLSLGVKKRRVVANFLVQYWVAGAVQYWSPEAREPPARKPEPLMASGAKPPKR